MAPPPPAGRVRGRREDPQPAARRHLKRGGAGRLGGEGVGGGRRGRGGGRGGQRGERGRRAERAVGVLHVHRRGGIARGNGRPGLPARSHGAGFSQLGSSLVHLLTARNGGGVVSLIEGRTTSES